MRNNGAITAAQIDKVRLPSNQAYNLPATAYTSPNVFELEAQHLFLDNWANVAHVNQVPNPGDYLAVDMFDHPLLVTRDADGEIHVMARVCQHKGTLLAEGAGNARVLVCPFHSWSYNLDGTLKAAPLMEGAENFDRDACRLPQIRTEIWEGFVFVNLSNEAEPLAPQLKGLSDYLRNWNLSELVPAHDMVHYEQEANWKINAESFLEAYHHLGAHSKTFQPTYPAAQTYPLESSGKYSMLSFGEAQADSATNVDGGNSLPFIDGLTEKEKLEPTVAFVWPSLLLGIGPDQIASYRILPTSAERHSIWINDLMPRSTVENPEYSQALKDRAHWATKIVHETDDMPVFEKSFTGIKSPYYDQGRLSDPYERCLWEFNQWWVGQLGEHVVTPD